LTEARTNLGSGRIVIGINVSPSSNKLVVGIISVDIANTVDLMSLYKTPFKNNI